MVKEADSLGNAGFEVTVLYAYWNHWGTLHDQQLFASKKWSAIRLGGDPDQKRITWFLSRLIHKISGFILQKTGNYKYLADLAIARSSYLLINGAKKYKADLYIAHNLGALPAAAKTAGFYKKPFSFDAEDFHRQEVNDDINSFHFKICRYLEDRYLPSANYFTASSPLIAGRYAALYKRTITTLLNVFPKTPALLTVHNEDKPLKLFWFSQTIGPNRGLEMIIQAMSLTKTIFELHLLGHPPDGYQRNLIDLMQTAGIDEKNILFYEPLNAGEIFNFASQFDIGIASETGFCLNNNIALSNKIFTYIQSGLAVAASNTPAQRGLLDLYPQIGKIYSNAAELSAILNWYHENRELLYKTKNEAFKIGQSKLNWENESQKFLNLVENVLTASSANEK